MRISDWSSDVCSSDLDGSEYTGNYDLGVAGLRRFHRPRLELLASAGADVLAIETLPCLAEVEAVLSELDRLGGVDRKRVVWGKRVSVRVGHGGCGLIKKKK